MDVSLSLNGLGGELGKMKGQTWEFGIGGNRMRNGLVPNLQPSRLCQSLIWRAMPSIRRRKSTAATNWPPSTGWSIIFATNSLNRHHSFIHSFTIRWTCSIGPRQSTTTSRSVSMHANHDLMCHYIIRFEFLAISMRF